MKQLTYKTAKEVSGLCAAIDLLAQAKKQANEADKQAKAAKEIIRRTLLDTRNVDIETLPESETVLVTIGTDRGLKIDRRGRDLIDVESLRIGLPDVAKQYTKRSVGTYFDPIG